MKVSFMGGAGGHWLSNLIYKLENNITYVLPSTKAMNHHFLHKSKNVELTHRYPDNTSVGFHGSKVFNIFINGAIKNSGFFQNLTDTKLMKYAEHASYAINYPADKITLNHDYIFSDPNKFGDELFATLSANNIIFAPNMKFVIDSIGSYRNTCINPLEYFDNWDKEQWLGWCYGIAKAQNMPTEESASTEELRDSLYANREFYIEFTRLRMIDIDDIT